MTPYEWCRRKRARPGRHVAMIDDRPAMTVFTITRIDHEGKTVGFALPGVWHDREWMAMDPKAGYELIAKGGVKV